MGSGRVIVREDSYGKRYRSIVPGFFWEVTRRRREEYAGRARPHTRRAEVSMGGGALCLGCNWHEKTPAPRGRELYAGSTRPPVRAEEGAGSACRASPAD